MIRRLSAILGVAVTEDAFVCAEVADHGNTTTRHGVFTLGGLRLDQPEQLGHALRAFLRQERFSATDAVVGIPARWVIAQEREVPPSTPIEAVSLLRLQAEKIAASDASDLAFDFIGEPAADRPSRVLVVGTLRDRLRQLQAVIDAAGLNLRAITPTALALMPSLKGADERSSLLLLGDRGADLVWRDGVVPRSIQHVPLNMNGHGRSLSLLGVELRRGVQFGSGGELLVLDTVGLSTPEMERLADTAHAGLRVRPAVLQAQAIDARIAPAAALASASFAGRPAVDFAHSRLAEPTRRRLDRRAWWGIAFGALAVFVIAFELIDYRMQTSELAALEEQAARVAPDVADAEATIARTSFGRGFFEHRPPALELLRDLTLAFGEDSRVWTTSVSYRDNGRGQLMGAATDQESVLALLDRMKANPAFSGVTLVDLRDASGTREREIAFSVSFTFQPEQAP